MIDLTMLTRKSVKTKLKEKWTLSRFLQYCDCTEDELRTRLLQIYGKDEEKTRRVLKEMRRNEKVKQKQPTESDMASIVEATPLTEANTTPSWTKHWTGQTGAIEDLVGHQDTVEATESQPTPISFEERVAELSSREESLSGTLMELERRWHAEKSLRRQCLKQLRSFEQKLVELREEIKAQYEGYRKVVDESNAHAQNMNELAEERKSVGDELDMVRAELESMNKVTLGVTLDGEIVHLDDSECVLNDAGHEAIFQRLIEEDLTADLRLKDVRAVSRLLAIFANSTVKIDVVCDDADTEAVFSLLAKK